MSEFEHRTEMTLRAAELSEAISRLAEATAIDLYSSTWLVRAKASATPLLAAAGAQAEREGRLVLHLENARTLSALRAALDAKVIALHHERETTCADRACVWPAASLWLAIERLDRHLPPGHPGMALLVGELPAPLSLEEHEELIEAVKLTEWWDAVRFILAVDDDLDHIAGPRFRGDFSPVWLRLD